MAENETKLNGDSKMKNMIGTAIAVTAFYMIAVHGIDVSGYLTW